MACVNSIVVDAPVDAVWSRLRNFHDMSWATGVVEQCEAVGEKSAEEIGAQRKLNGVFHETLLALDDENRVLRYSIDDGPPAVAKDNTSGYVGEVTVFPVTAENKSFVLWSYGWDSSSQDVQAFCDPIYQALLNALRQQYK